MSNSERGEALSAIVGLGQAGITRDDTSSAHELAIASIREAIAEAGLEGSDVDGLLMARSPVKPDGYLPRDLHSLKLQREAGLRDLQLYQLVQAGGSTVGQMIQTATEAIRAGSASNVVCVYADTPLMQSGSGGENYGNVVQYLDCPGLESAYGLFGPPSAYAMAARRHMGLYGTTEEHLAAVAVSNRKWANKNPDAVMSGTLTVEDHHDSRWIAEPFRLLDCAVPVNGAMAVLVTDRERARDRPTSPAYVVGYGQGHPGSPQESGSDDFVHTGAVQSGEMAFEKAGITAEDVDVCEFYDPFSYVDIVTLEDYGFCEKGEGGPFVAEGHTEPGGSLPTNTGGGHLSGFYLEGMTPLSEAVQQVRGEAGDRQVDSPEVVLVSNSGGYLEYHSTVLLSHHERLHG